MNYRSLGKSGLFVSPVALGSWVTFNHQLGQKTINAMMSLAYESGINLFDTAEVYGEGVAETLMGRAIRDLNWDRSSFVLCSKVYWGGDKPTQKGLSRKHVIEACHQSLKRLQVEYLDLFLCHRPDPDTPILETVRAMDTLIRQGKILYWGTSEWEAWQIVEAFELAKSWHLTPPSLEQPQYNLFERERIEKDYLPLFMNYGLGAMTWSPLSSGLLTGKYAAGVPDSSRLSLEHLSWLKDHFLGDERRLIDTANSLIPLAGDLGCSPAQLAIAWCLKNPNVSSVLLGASKIEQLEENIKAIQFVEKIDDELLGILEQNFQNAPVLGPDPKTLS
jgi:voltage-dependent potassium channel beta subunit